MCVYRVCIYPGSQTGLVASLPRPSQNVIKTRRLFVRGYMQFLRNENPGSRRALAGATHDLLMECFPGLLDTKLPRQDYPCTVVDLYTLGVVSNYQPTKHGTNLRGLKPQQPFVVGRSSSSRTFYLISSACPDAVKQQNAKQAGSLPTM